MLEQSINNSQPEILQDRYQLGKLLDTGSIGSVYQAIDLQSSTSVAVKIISLQKVRDWKTLELFEREAKALAQLEHPQIPKYIDYFHVDTETDRKFYIVQQLASGRSLAKWVANGHQFTLNEVDYIARQILNILKYLQSFSPAIIHRDLKPQNIIYDNKANNPYLYGHDVHVYLVDFGSIKNTYHQTITGGSTVVGTYSYMAPEQFRGQANVTTDLYGIATTLLFLLTGQDPAHLPQQHMKLDTQGVVSNQSLKDWLDRCLEPFPENRFANAEVALKHLRHLHYYRSEQYPRPKYPIAQVTRSDVPPELQIYIPPVWLKSKVSRQILIVNTLILAVVSFLTWLLIIADLPVLLMVFMLLCLTHIGGAMISWSEPFDDVKSTWWTHWSLRIRYIIPRWLFWPILPVATFILIVINHQINHNYGLSTNYALPSLPILLFLWGYTISRCLSHLGLMSESYRYQLVTCSNYTQNIQTDRIQGRAILDLKKWLFFSERILYDEYGFSDSKNYRFSSVDYYLKELLHLIDKDEEWWLRDEIDDFLRIHEIRR
jgi:eukaryotic-like serine/threonine-protein kinase